VNAGQESRITIGMQAVPTARIEGMVMTADGQPAPMNGMQLMLQRVTSVASSSSSVRMTDAGTFLAMGVPPGHWVLTARITGQDGRGGMPPGMAPQQAPLTGSWFAQQEIDVAGVDMAGIVLTLAPPMTITGRVVFDGTPPGPGSQVQVRLDSVGRAPVSSMARNLKVNEAGEFSLSGVTPGRYRFAASVSTPRPEGAPPVVFSPNAPPPPSWSVKSATIDGRDAFETAFEVQAGRPPQNVVISMTMRLPQLSATISDAAGKPIPNMTFVLFSASREHWTGQTARRVRSQSRPLDDGTYLFTSILPGEYYLAVVTDLESSDLSDTSFLEQLIPAAIKMTFAEGDKKVQNLRVK